MGSQGTGGSILRALSTRDSQMPKALQCEATGRLIRRADKGRAIANVRSVLKVAFNYDRACRCPEGWRNRKGARLSDREDRWPSSRRGPPQHRSPMLDANAAP